MGVFFWTMQTINILRTRTSLFATRLSVFGARSYCMDAESNTFNVQNHQRLQQLIRGKRYERAQDYYDHLIRQGVQPTLTTHYIMAECLVKQDKDSEAYQLLESLKEESSYVDARAYNPFVSAFSISGKIEKAIELVETMKRENITPNGGTYSALVRGYAAEGMMDKSAEVLETMLSAGIIPTKLPTQILLADMFALEICKMLSLLLKRLKLMVEFQQIKCTRILSAVTLMLEISMPL